MARLPWLFAVLASLAALPSFAQPNFYLKDGDTVVFYGDSITDQRLYTAFTETYTVTRFPHLRVRFVHSGWGGDRVTGGGGGPIDLRLRRDVIPFRPTVVTIMLGMNDGHYRSYDDAIFDQFANGYRGIVSSLRTALPDLRITAIEPSPYDDVTRKPLFEGGYNAVLVRYGQFIAGLASSQHLDLADLNSPVTAMLARADASNPALAQKILPDRVHPGPGGHLIMAEALLKAWNAPALVSDVSLDAARTTPVRSTNATISSISRDGGLHWSETDQALPMPVDWKDEAAALAVHSSDFLDALDREMLTVTGLEAGRYTLKIDDSPAGTFTSDQLSAGINLAAYDTPMSRQAATVHSFTVKHNAIHFARWRSVQVPLDGEGFDDAAAESALDHLEDQVIAAQRMAAQPRDHHYDLVREP